LSLAATNVTPQTQAYGNISTVVAIEETTTTASVKLASAAPVTSSVAVATVPRSEIEALVREYFSDAPVMVQIARCESGFRQFNGNGVVLKNPTSSAKGIFQIMESLHTRTAANLGHDILTIEGNLGYARHLYEKEGTRPWNASKHCWGNTLAMN